MTAYDAAAWSDFALAVAGATAALTGLLFVAVSLNIERILRHPHLPGRAAMTLGVLVTILLSSLLVLAPGQSRVALGVGLAVLGLVLGIADVTWLTRAPVVADEPRQGVRAALPPLVPAVALMVGGLSVEAGAGGGLYWFLAACGLGIAVAVLDAWLLLVEINR